MRGARFLSCIVTATRSRTKASKLRAVFDVALAVVSLTVIRMKSSWLAEEKMNDNGYVEMSDLSA